MNDVIIFYWLLREPYSLDFFFVVTVKVGMYFRMIWTTEHAVFMQVFSADHPESLLEKYFYLGFLIVIGKS